jgi:hypothetical protein
MASIIQSAETFSDVHNEENRALEPPSSTYLVNNISVRTSSLLKEAKTLNTRHAVHHTVEMHGSSAFLLLNQRSVTYP